LRTPQALSTACSFVSPFDSVLSINLPEVTPSLPGHDDVFADQVTDACECEDHER
jgi:hypothetical protein